MLGIGTLRRVAGEVRRDVRAAYERDPAAKGVSRPRCWRPGRACTRCSRTASRTRCDAAGVPVAPRVIAYVSRSLTGIEIHPAARIGDGAVHRPRHGRRDRRDGRGRGERDDVPGRDARRHRASRPASATRPCECNVTIGSGAKLLGPITIGHGAKIGANAVVIHDVPPNSTVVGNPGHPVRVEGRKPEGPDADWVHLPDPIADALKQLSRRIEELEREVAVAARRGASRRGRGRPAASRPRPESRRWLGSRTRVEIPRPPEEVFPWLLEEDKVPRWTGHLESYERLGGGELGNGSRVRQVLEVSGRTIDVELEITAYDPPTRRRDAVLDQRDRGRQRLRARGVGRRHAAHAVGRRQAERADGADARPGDPAAARGEAHGGPRAPARGAGRVARARPAPRLALSC